MGCRWGGGAGWMGGARGRGRGGGGVFRGGCDRSRAVGLFDEVVLQGGSLL